MLVRAVQNVGKQRARGLSIVAVFAEPVVGSPEEDRLSCLVDLWIGVDILCVDELALFGVESVPYTSIINIANVFFMYTISVYFFAREQFSLKQAIISIFKIPAIWFASFALFLN